MGDVTLRIEMLGGFSIIANDNNLTQQIRKSSKIWRIIQYLIANRRRAVPQEELLDVFCDDDSKNNSSSVIRTMIYRARAALEESGLDVANDIIIAKSGCYSWNNDIACVTDIEELEELSRQASELGINEEEKLSLLLGAVSLYKGDLLPNSSGDMWVTPLSRYYRNIYFTAVRDVLEILMNRGRAVDAEAICVKALTIDQFDEDIIKCHLRTLLAQGKNTEALTAYKKAEALFYDVLGVDFSEELHDMYNDILTTEVNDDVPLTDIVTQWSENLDNTSPYCCDTSVFRILYQIEARSLKRSGKTAYLVRFNTKHDPDPKLIAKGGVMKQLERSIASSMRMGDIYTRCTPNQYMIMLRNLTYEDCKMLINRILGNIDSKFLPKIVDTSIMLVTPTGE